MNKASGGWCGALRALACGLALVGCAANDPKPSEAIGPAAECFADISTGGGADYDQYRPTVGAHCKGTNHQLIEGVERVVFLGDSVTAGTPPTPVDGYFRNLVTEQLRAKFGDAIEVQDCSRYGARNDDFLLGSQAQIPQCFPDAVDSRRTLIIFTMGGNDISNWAQDNLSAEAATVEADLSADLLDDAIAELTSPTRFPNGSFVVFANPYEFTDGTGDLHACPLAVTAFPDTPEWTVGRPAVLHFQERYMQIAVEHQVDMVFMLESFCGHGYHRDDPSIECYRGPDAELWFDLTCTHPTPAGHAALADLFMSVIND